MGLEGIVSKRTDASYRSGPSKTWGKTKNPASAAVRRELGCRRASAVRLMFAFRKSFYAPRRRFCGANGEQVVAMEMKVLHSE
jgi:hypothetical protein